MRGQLDGPVEQRLVLDDPVDLDAAGGGHDHLGPGVVDAHGQLVGGEAAEDDRVDRPEPGAGQHGHHRLGHHRHVDHDPVAPSHAEGAQHPGEARHLVAQLPVGLARRDVPVTGLS